MRFTFARSNVRKLLSLPGYALAGLAAVMFPRSKTLWVFGRKTGVGEGPLRLLNVVRERYPHVRTVWIAQDQQQYMKAQTLGLEVHLKSSWMAKWLTLRAGVGVVTHGFGDLCRPFVPGMYLIQLWHGAPLKRLHLDAPVAQVTGLGGVLAYLSAWMIATMFKVSARFIRCMPSPSERVSARLRSAWGWRDAPIRLTGDPRCDVLLEGDHFSRRRAARTLLAELWHAEVPPKLVLYAPTWRDGAPDPELPDARDLHALNRALAAADAWLVIRSHPWGFSTDVMGEGDLSRVKFLPNDMLDDVNQALNAFDVLITDYSAIAIDYSLLERPIVFYAPDLEAYQRSRGFYESYAEHAGGPWCERWQEVAGQLEESLNDSPSTPCPARRASSHLTQRYHRHRDGRSAQRLLEEVARDLRTLGPGTRNRPPNVLHVTGCLGGVESYLQLLAQHHDESRVRFAFVLPKPCALSQYASTRRFALHMLPLTRSLAPLADLKAALALRRIVRSERPDIVHLHSSKAGLVGRLACLRLPTRVVYTPHAYFHLSRRGMLRRLFILAEHLLDKIAGSTTLATSPSEYGRAIRDIGCHPQRVECVLNAVEVEDIARHRVGGAEGRREVVLVARVSAQKNIPMFLRTIAKLRGKSDARFHLVGVGHYSDDRRRLTSMMREAGITASELNIIDWMPRDRLIGFMATARVVVLTSAYESFGYVLAEANCLGIPVVGTDVDGIRDVISDGENGYLVPDGNAEAMAAKLLMLLSDDTLWLQMSDRALSVARERFDMRNAVRQFESFYENKGAHAQSQYQ